VLCHPGLRAWRLAHALLLRGVETPAPLALVETRRFGLVAESVLLTRCSDDTLELAAALAGAPERAHEAGRELARWHAQGVEASALELRARPEPWRIVALRPERARLHTLLAPAERERDLARIAERLGPDVRAALADGYRAAAS
jgi:hypothetical protein